MGEAGMDSPSCKTNTFFLRSLALSVPIYKKFQTNINNKHIIAVIIEENWEETMCYLEILSTVRM